MDLFTSKQELYERLADHYGQERQARLRDIFLALAADAALAEGRREEAERLRRRLVMVSPNSLFAPFATWSEASKSLDVEKYLDNLRHQYPEAEAAQLLNMIKDNAPDRSRGSSKKASSLADLLKEDKPPESFPLEGDVAPTLAGSPPAAGNSPLEKPLPKSRPRSRPDNAQPPKPKNEVVEPVSSIGNSLFAGILFFFMVFLGGAVLTYVILRPFLHWE